MADPRPAPDLQAYVDGQLDPAARAEVEGWLADRPAEAARVMGDLGLMNSLRAALAAPARPRRRLVLPLLALVLVMAVAGPLSIRAVTASGVAPAFVASALAARQASLLRLQMVSMPESPDVDAEELRAATGILLPDFPADWLIRDAQVFPSPEGPGIEMVFETPDLGLVTAFAVRPGDFAVTPPASAQRPEGAVAWLRMGETAHVLIASEGEATAVAAMAGRLFAGLE